MQKSKWSSSISRLKSKPLTLAGLTLGVFGAILLAFSVEITDTWIPPPALYHITINQVKFRAGLAFIAFGFVLQSAGIGLEK